MYNSCTSGGATHFLIVPLNPSLILPKPLPMIAGVCGHGSDKHNSEPPSLPPPYSRGGRTGANLF